MLGCFPGCVGQPCFQGDGSVLAFCEAAVSGYSVAAWAQRSSESAIDGVGGPGRRLWRPSARQKSAVEPTQICEKRPELFFASSGWWSRKIPGRSLA